MNEDLRYTLKFRKEKQILSKLLYSHEFISEIVKEKFDKTSQYLKKKMENLKFLLKLP